MAKIKYLKQYCFYVNLKSVTHYKFIIHLCHILVNSVNYWLTSKPGKLSWFTAPRHVANREVSNSIIRTVFVIVTLDQEYNCYAPTAVGIMHVERGTGHVTFLYFTYYSGDPHIKQRPILHFNHVLVFKMEKNECTLKASSAF